MNSCMFEPETDTESKDKPYTKDTPCDRAAIHPLCICELVITSYICLNKAERCFSHYIFETFAKCEHVHKLCKVWLW